MKIINNTKFFSFNELADCLNAVSSENEKYKISELVYAWADARAKYYQTTGSQVEEGVHYIETGEEQLLFQAGCKLIEELANVDGHNMPIMQDGAADLFKF